MIMGVMACVLIMLTVNPNAPATAPAAQRVQFRLVAGDDDRDAEVVQLARPEADETELRLVRAVVVDGSAIDRAQADRDRTLGQWMVSVHVYRGGIPAALRGDARQHRAALAMVVDGLIITAPTIRDPIRRSAEINGEFDRERAEHLTKAIDDAARKASTQSSR